MFYFSIDPGFVKTLGPLAAPAPEVPMDHLQAPDPALTWDCPGMSCRGFCCVLEFLEDVGIYLVGFVSYFSCGRRKVTDKWPQELILAFRSRIIS